MEGYWLVVITINWRGSMAPYRVVHPRCKQNCGEVDDDEEYFGVGDHFARYDQDDEDVVAMLLEWLVENHHEDIVPLVKLHLAHKGAIIYHYTKDSQQKATSNDTKQEQPQV
jgi:hypothetical protein